MATWICLKVGLVKGMLYDGIKPLPEPMLMYYKLDT